MFLKRKIVAFLALYSFLGTLSPLGTQGFADTSTTGGSRVIENATQDGDLIQRINDGGVRKDVIRAVGSTGQVVLGAPGDTAGVSVNGPLALPAITKGIVESSSSGVLSSTNLWTCGTAVDADCTSSPCTLVVNYGGCVSAITRAGLGAYTATFTTSFWSTAPVCTATVADTAIRMVRHGPTVSTTSAQIVIYDPSTSLNIDSGFTLMCIGPRS